MDPRKGFEGDSQGQSRGSGELDAEQQAFAANLFDHLVVAECFSQFLLQLKTNLSGTVAKSFVLEHIEGCQPGAHRQAVFAERGCVNNGALKRTENRLVDFVRHQYGTYRNQATAQGFRQHDDVRGKPEMMR